MNKTLAAALLSFAACYCAPASAQVSRFADYAGFGHSVKPDVVYHTASGTPLKLDLYLPAGARGKVPVVLYFHGGGWVDGRKENASLLLLPYLAQGWAVVNADYRLARTAAAPAAVEDARCAFRWVQRNAQAYGFDPAAIVLAGDSAGGHLALAAAFLPAGSAFDRACPAADSLRWTGGVEAPLRAAAVVNWFGVADVADLLDGPNRRNFAVEWFGSAAGAAALAQSVSPLPLVRPALPPVISVHGSVDPVVPYAQSAALHHALERAGVRNRLVTVEGGRHGAFSRPDVERANDAIRAFLQESGVAPSLPLHEAGRNQQR